MHKKIALLCISLIACNKITAADWWLEEHGQAPVAQHAEKVVAQSAPAAPVIELPEESSGAQQWLRRVEVVVAGVVGVAAVCYAGNLVKRELARARRNYRWLQEQRAREEEQRREANMSYEERQARDAQRAREARAQQEAFERRINKDIADGRRVGSRATPLQKAQLARAEAELAELQARRAKDAIRVADVTQLQDRLQRIAIQISARSWNGQPFQDLSLQQEDLQNQIQRAEREPRRLALVHYQAQQRLEEAIRAERALLGAAAAPAAEEPSDCIICCVNIPDHRWTCCGRVTCASCAGRMHRCPFCRQ